MAVPPALADHSSLRAASASLRMPVSVGIGVAPPVLPEGHALGLRELTLAELEIAIEGGVAALS